MSDAEGQLNVQCALGGTDNGRLRAGGVAALVGSKTLDGAVTLFAVTGGRAVERNPVARAAFDVLGVGGGVVVLGAVAVCIAVGGVEVACVWLDRDAQNTVRVTAYGSLATVWLVLALYGAWLTV